MIDETFKIPIKQRHLAPNGLLTKKRKKLQISLKSHISPPKKSKNSFIFATIARQNVQSIFQCKTELCNTNAEVVRLKQMLFINFVAYLQSIVERHKT